MSNYETLMLLSQMQIMSATVSVIAYLRDSDTVTDEFKQAVTDDLASARKIMDMMQELLAGEKHEP